MGTSFPVVPWDLAASSCLASSMRREPHRWPGVLARSQLPFSCTVNDSDHSPHARSQSPWKTHSHSTVPPSFMHSTHGLTQLQLPTTRRAAYTHTQYNHIPMTLPHSLIRSRSCHPSLEDRQKNPTLHVAQAPTAG